MMATGTQYGTAGACRNSYATEWSSLMIHLVAMQGIGKDGVNLWGGTAHGAPLDMSFKSAGYSDVGWDVFGLVAKQATFPDRNAVTQKVYRISLPEAILDGHIEWLGEGFCVQYAEQQFKPMQYPEPGPNGAEIRMIHRHGGSFISTMTDTSKWVRMYQSPKLEFVVMQDCHWQSETKFGDLILPASTNFEHEDISEWAQPGGYGNGNVNCNHRILMYQQKCIEPLWESKPDYQIYCELAERLGILRGVHRGQLRRGLDQEGLRLHRPAQAHLLRGVQEEGLLRGARRCPTTTSPPSPTSGTTRAGRWTPPTASTRCRAPTRPPQMATPSGKIEFVRDRLQEYFPDDEERPPMPRYIPLYEGHETTGLVDKYPLILMTPHAKYSYHTHQDNKILWLNDIRQHRIVKDGYAYWPMRMNPVDAEARGIKDGDIVMVYNDRAKVLGVALVTERCRPGLVHSYQAGAKYDPLRAGRGRLDRPGRVREPAVAFAYDQQERIRRSQHVVSRRSLQVGGIVKWPDMEW